MVRIPPYLEAGDLIGILCPAGFFPAEKAEPCLETLRSWGYKVKEGRTLGGDSSTYFSGTDNERLEDIQAMMDDPDIKAILCARGGYGTGRIIDRIDFTAFEKNPKWVIGFSDVTVLHAHIYTNFKIAGLHAPMASAFAEGSGNEFVRSFHAAISGTKNRYHCASHPLNRKGEAVAELVGGNLSLLVNLIGTASDLKTKGRILFLEDTGEYLYHIDRMMHQMDRAGKLEKLAGLIVGGFTSMQDTERPFGETVYELIRERVRKYDYPVCFGFPVSHEKENYALKVGVGYKLKVGKSKVSLEE
jgi:muramoyltetrapeptide carboxypeptidase